MKKINKYLIAIFIIFMVCGCGKKETIISEWIVAEGAPKESAAANEGDFYYDKTTNNLYQLKSKEWVLLGQISNSDKISNGNNSTGNNNSTCENTKPGNDSNNKCETTIPVIGVSEDGYLLVNGEKTGSTLKGEKGTKGDDGATGKDGKDGKSPVVSIGKDGYIYIDKIKLNFKEYKNGCYQVSDEDKDKELDVGDTIKCGTEEFYVVYNDGNKIHMLSKYNLDVGKIYDVKKEQFSNIENPTGLQNSNSIGYKENSEKYYGVVEYSTTYYWGNLKPIYGTSFPAYVYDSNTDIFNYLKKYKEKLIELEAIIENVRLPKYQEVYSYICSEEENTCDQSEYKWILNTSFWTGTAEDNKRIKAINTSGEIINNQSRDGSLYGIRPLVEILDENIIR